MFMRFVHIKIKEERLTELGGMYEQNIIPALEKRQGCLYAGLIQSEHHSDECISLTMWDTKSNADLYEHSGLFASLLHEAEPFFAGTSEWKIQLAPDMTVQYEPVPEVPSIDAYTIAASNGTESVPKEKSFYIRIVSPHIQSEKVEEFKRIYIEEILPALRQTRGCRFAYLEENTKAKDQIISVTLWESKNDADDYEQSAAYKTFNEKLRTTFSGVYQWKKKLEEETGKRVVTSDDVAIEGYKIIAGKSFL
jgi:quinol monooxygenase YgiN